MSGLFDNDEHFFMTNEVIQAAARAVNAHIPDTHGFILILAPYGDHTADNHVKADYVATCKRADAIAILKTVLFRWGINEEWMKELK